MAEEGRSRAVIVAGNWKMNLGPEETRTFLRRLTLPEAIPGLQALLFPPALSLAAAREALRDTGAGRQAVELGVQNIHWEPSGAFTGELSAELARSAGVTHALVGHSERRHLFGETDSETARKVEAAFRAGLVPVLCVGETLEERRQGRLEDVLQRQLDAVLGPEVLRSRIGEEALLLAYEPVWAIGTGETATPEDASHAHALLRARVGEALGPERAAALPILYGGSVNPGNAATLLGAPDVDGVLVGGASLDPESFAAIAAAAAGGQGRAPGSEAVG